MSKWLPGRFGENTLTFTIETSLSKIGRRLLDHSSPRQQFQFGCRYVAYSYKCLHGPGPDSGRSHPTCMATLPSQLSLTVGNAVLFTPFDGHLPKFDLLEPIPSVPQVVFGE